MSRPQLPGVIVQVFVVWSQRLPAVHVPRAVHGWPMPPVSVELLHVPAVQTRPPSQLPVPLGETPSAAQQGPSMRPQRIAGSGAVSQLPLMGLQTSPALTHAVAPSQQRMPDSPQPSQ